MTLRDDLDRIAREAAKEVVDDVVGNAEWSALVVIRRALAEFGEACAKQVERGSTRRGVDLETTKELADQLRSALGQEAPK